MAEQLTEEQKSAATNSFVAYGACGHLVACAVDRPEYARDNAKTVASWVRDGLRIGNLTVGEVRTAKWCDCKRTRKAK
jgi:hypothetical protein